MSAVSPETAFVRAPSPSHAANGRPSKGGDRAPALFSDLLDSNESPDTCAPEPAAAAPVHEGKPAEPARIEKTGKADGSAAGPVEADEVAADFAPPVVAAITEEIAVEAASPLPLPQVAVAEEADALPQPVDDRPSADSPDMPVAAEAIPLPAPVAVVAVPMPVLAAEPAAPVATENAVIETAPPAAAEAAIPAVVIAAAVAKPAQPARPVAAAAPTADGDAVSHPDTLAEGDAPQVEMKAASPDSPAQLAPAKTAEAPAAQTPHTSREPAVALRSESAKPDLAPPASAPAPDVTSGPSALTAPQAAHYSIAPQAAPAAAPQQAATVMVPVSGLAVEIAAHAQGGKNHFEIRLDPPELGRIDVRLEIDGDGRVTSHLRVERAETLDLLRRDALSLERALQQAGLKTSDNGLQFSLRDQAFAQRDQDRAPAMARIVVPDDALVPAETQRPYTRLAGLGSGVDIRV